MQAIINEESIERANVLFWGQMLAMEMKRSPWTADDEGAHRCALAKNIWWADAG